MDEIYKIAEARRLNMPANDRVTAFKAAAAAYICSDRQGEPMARALIKFAGEDPGPEANPVATAIHAAMGRHLRQEAGIDKQAYAFWEGIKRLVPTGASTLIDGLKIIGAAGLGAGAIGGAGVFGTQRLLEGDDAETLKLERRRAAMKRLTAEIDRELKVRKLAPTPENQAAVVDYLT